MQKHGSFSAAATHPPATFLLLERSMQFPHSGECLSLLASQKAFLLWGIEGSLKQDNPFFSFVSMIIYSFGTRGGSFSMAPVAHNLSHWLHTETEGDFFPLDAAPAKQKGHTIS